MGGSNQEWAPGQTKKPFVGVLLFSGTSYLIPSQLTGKMVIYYKKYQMRTLIQQVSLTSLYSGLSVFFLMVVLLLDFLCTSGLR